MTANTVIALLESEVLADLSAHVRNTYTDPQWARGECGSLATGIAKYLDRLGLPYAIEMDRRPGRDGSMWGGNHVRIRSGSVIIDTEDGEELASLLMTVPGAQFLPVTPEEITAEEIRISKTLSNRVFKDLLSALPIHGPRL